MRIECRNTDGIGCVTLHTDAVPTAPAEVSAAVAALRGFLETRDLRGLVLAGAGRHFWPSAPCAQDAAARPASGVSEALRAWFDTLAFAPVPTVAALRGTCRAIGVATALCCHFRVAARSARLDFAPDPLSDPSPAAPWPCLAEWQARVAPLRASGRTIAAQEARAIGLVDSVAPSPALRDEACALIASLTSGRSPSQVRSILHAVHGGRTLPADAALRLETGLFCELALLGTRGAAGPVPRAGV